MKVLDLNFIANEVRRVDVAPDMAMVYDGVASGGVHWRWEHLCEVYEDQEWGTTQKRVASYLSRGHRIVSSEPLTIEGSLRCLSCNLHGFIHDDRWAPA